MTAAPRADVSSPSVPAAVHESDRQPVGTAVAVGEGVGSGVGRAVGDAVAVGDGVVGGSQDAPIMGPVIRSYLGGVEIGEPGKGMKCVRER